MFSDTLAYPRLTTVVKPLEAAAKQATRIKPTVPLARPQTSITNAITKAARTPTVAAELAQTSKCELSNAMRVGIENRGANMGVNIGTNIGANIATKMPTSGIAATIAQSAKAFNGPADAAGLGRFAKITKSLTVMNILNAAQIALFIHAIYLGVLESNENHKGYQMAVMGHNDDVEPLIKCLQRCMKIVNPRTKSDELSEHLGAMGMNIRNAGEAYEKEITAAKEFLSEIVPIKSIVMEIAQTFERQHADIFSFNAFEADMSDAMEKLYPTSS